MKRDALLFEQKESGECTCLTCARECRISEGGKGWCATRIVQDGRPYTLTYGEVSSCSISPIESEPVFHFLPGSKWLALGSVGCNFRCPGCHNWEVAHWKGGDLQTTFVPPDELVAQALARGCRGITWAYNEPTLWLEYTLDCALLAKDAGLYTSYVTNGFLTWQSLEKLSPYLDVYRVDIKGFSDRTYQKFTSVKEWGTVLANTALAAQFGMHVEVITNVIPGVNDDLKELEDLAAWIEDAVGAHTPWHVTRFFPHLYLNEYPETALEQLEKFREIGRKQGLWYVYVGNVPGHRAESTFCHMCGEELVERRGPAVLQNRLLGGRCPVCNTAIPGTFQDISLQPLGRNP